MPQVNIRVESVSDEEQQTGVPSQKKEDKKGAKSTVGSIFVHQAMNTTKQIINTGVSNIGNFTGDYVKQDQVGAVVSAVTDITTVAIGFAVNPIAGAFALVGVGIKAGLNVATQLRNDEHARIQSEYLKERSGNTLNNGSRTGE